MSWLTENYEKAALGGAAVIALGVGALILSSDAGPITAELDPKKENKYTVAELKDLGNYNKSLDTESKDEFVQYLEEDLNSFVAFPLYGVKDVSGLTELKNSTLFEGIPLGWWREHKLDDYKYSGSSKKDNDKDGFNNLEEYTAKTSPIDAKSHPDLVAKLKLLGSKPQRFRIQWSRVDENRANMTFTSGRSKTSFDITGVGDTFPTARQSTAFLNRFKVKGKGREKNPATSGEDEFFEIEDLTKKKTYKLFKSDGPKSFIDWIVTLKLDTPDGGQEFTVPEGAEFSLPYVKGGKGYTFKLNDKRDAKTKKLNNIEIEHKDGDKPHVQTLEFVEPEPEPDTGEPDV